jgi:hypothetical protein
MSVSLVFISEWIFFSNHILFVFIKLQTWHTLSVKNLIKLHRNQFPIKHFWESHHQKFTNFQSLRTLKQKFFCLCCFELDHNEQRLWFSAPTINVVFWKCHEWSKFELKHEINSILIRLTLFLNSTHSECVSVLRKGQ